MLVFTVVTIIFVRNPLPRFKPDLKINREIQLPLSFMAAFFAINIDSFPWNKGDKLPMDYVLRYMCMQNFLCLLQPIVLYVSNILSSQHIRGNIHPFYSDCIEPGSHCRIFKEPWKTNGDCSFYRSIAGNTTFSHLDQGSGARNESGCDCLHCFVDNTGSCSSQYIPFVQQVACEREHFYLFIIIFLNRLLGHSLKHCILRVHLA